MKFEITPEEAHPIAKAVCCKLRKQGMKVVTERPGWRDAPYRTTLSATKSGLTILVEAQGTPNYGAALKALTHWLAARRMYSELYIATGSESIVVASMFSEMKEGGVGLIVVDEAGHVSTSQSARNPALEVTPDPTLRYGGCRGEVEEAVRKFNETNRKDGLRDMCEIVERLTKELALGAAGKGWIKTPLAAIEGKDWSSTINELARVDVYNSGYDALISTALKDDLHSFRGARNLVDHPARNRRDDKKRQKQFAERMLQGPRLAAELVSLRRKVK